MDASERLSLVIGLAQLWQASPLECDTLVSAFAAACKSGRKATVCRPFPTHVVGGEAWQAAASALDSLGDISDIAAASDTQLRLLQWLLLHLQRSWRVRAATAAEVLRDAGPACVLPASALNQCCCLLRLDAAVDTAAAGQQQQHLRGGQLWAFHGTGFDCLHSILQHGLLSASGTRLQSTGALFGHGIYLATDWATSFAFCSGREGWRGSSIGRHLRCVLLCEVAEGAVSQPPGPSAAAGGTNGASNRQQLPDKYVVASRPADVTLRYLLVYCDDALLGCHPSRRRSSTAGGSGSGSGGGSTAGADGGGDAARPLPQLHAANLCWVLTVALVALMLATAAWRWAATATAW